MTDRNSSDDDPVTSDRIPSLINIGEIPSSYGQNLHTDVIDPVTISQRRARFTLSRVAGFLHSESRITLGIVPKTNARAYYPLNVGVSNVIKSAQLIIGQESVCSIDDYSHFHQYQSMFVSNENNKEREQYLSQRCISHAPVYDGSVNDATDKPMNSAKSVGLDLGRNPIVNETDDTGAMQLLPFQVHNATDAQTIADAPVYSVYLSDLFPFLKFNQLPTFMMDQEVHIDLTFQDEMSILSGTSYSRRMCIGSTEDRTISYEIDTEECKLIYDSITYDAEVMRQYAQQNPVLSFSYVDYRLAKRTGDEDAFSNLVFPIGGNGRQVTKIMFAATKNATADPRSLLNNVTANQSSPDNNLAINLLYNDLYEFNVDRSNPALLFHTTQQAEGAIPMITKDEWKVGGTAAAPRNALTIDTFEGHDQSATIAGLGGQFAWTAIRPNKGQRVNNKGMTLIYKNPNLEADNYTLRCYLELMKQATITNGKFSCSFA